MKGPRAGIREDGSLRLAGLLSGVLAFAGCSEGLGPRTLIWEGATLEKNRTWELDELQGAVYVPPGQELEATDVQLGVIRSTNRLPASLNEWVMLQYSGAPELVRFHETVRDTAACKVGQMGPRRFVAVHVCREKAGLGSVCVEADNRKELRSFCDLYDTACWDSFCRQHLDSIGPKLESLLESLTL